MVTLSYKEAAQFLRSQPKQADKVRSLYGQTYKVGGGVRLAPGEKQAARYALYEVALAANMANQSAYEVANSPGAAQFDDRAAMGARRASILSFVYSRLAFARLYHQYEIDRTSLTETPPHIFGTSEGGNLAFVQITNPKTGFVEQYPISTAREGVDTMLELADKEILVAADDGLLTEGEYARLNQLIGESRAQMAGLPLAFAIGAGIGLVGGLLAVAVLMPRTWGQMMGFLADLLDQREVFDDCIATGENPTKCFGRAFGEASKSFLVPALATVAAVTVAMNLKRRG